MILPPTTAADRMGLGTVTRVLINASLGTATQVARPAPIALAPGAEASLTVTAPNDPARARKGVQGDVNGLFLVLGLVSLVVGAIGIANVTLVTVIERIRKIGLRRALKEWTQVLDVRLALGAPVAGALVGLLALG